MTQDQFQKSAQDFLAHLFDEIETQQIEIKNHWDIDHLCYRVADLFRYEDLKRSFAGFAELLIESEVNGRPIATFRLKAPIEFRNWRIDLVELPAPKPSKPTEEGFEHIEVVSDLPMGTLEKKYRHLNLDRGGFNKDFNPELEIQLGKRNLKFHPLSLNSVINLEKNVPVFQALKKSGILKDFKSHSPLVAGTFPLGISVQNSDLDILMTAQDPKAFEKSLTDQFSKLPDFKIRHSQVENQDTVIANFTIDLVPFEVFAQATDSYQQKAYLHFLCEERLLKIGGDDFQKKIHELRHNQGLKTEPAFAKALNLPEDPYLALLKLQTMSFAELKAYF